MIDIRDLRENPEKYRKGAADKNYDVDVARLLEVDKRLRAAMREREELTAEKNRIGKEIGKVAGQMKKAEDGEKVRLEGEMKKLRGRPNEIKEREQELGGAVSELGSERDEMLMRLPQPAGEWVPVGKGEEDTVERGKWDSDDYDTSKSFEENRGFAARSHVELMEGLNMVDFGRGVKMAGTRSYVLKGMGMRLHQAILRYAFDFMTIENGFTGVSVPVMVKGGRMEGTGFFPYGKDQAYEIGNPTGEDDELYLTGTGEVGLMGFHAGEILDEGDLPLCYTTVSTCFRREAGSAGKDTAGLFRVHQFDKVEQVVICRADEEESRGWHKKMLGYAETLMRRLGLPYRLMQCCTGDLGPKNVDMIDVEGWVPSRGEVGEDGVAKGAYAETHSASVLFDYQCRRLNTRYKDEVTGKNVVCHALNNTVAASPRILIPIVEMYQNEDGTVRVPDVLVKYMGGVEVIG